MSTPRQDGGPAFPYAFEHDGHANISGFAPGMSLRDWFAGNFQIPAEMDKSIDQADDGDLLERYGTAAEREQGFRMVFGSTNPQFRHMFANVEVSGNAMPLENILLRQKLEARVRAEMRYIEADAMLAARGKHTTFPSP